ncbi:hypothetical protein QE152_g6861 [Popillia japonica]|uniref:Uncharacterized protein n=1 Tax=Popillia japonica TaxID=7064 RepID=A0AAW1MD43_POPJA
MNKVGEVDIFLNSYDEKVRVVALTEHWLTADGMSGMCLDGYVLASSFCRAERQHGGCCIFVADDVAFVEMTNLRQKSIEMVVECSSVYIPKYSMLIIGSLCAEVTNYNAHFLRQGRKHIYRKENNYFRIIMPISSAKVENTYTERRIITSDNLTEMEEYLNTIDWSSIINDCDADTCYNNLTSILSLEVIMNKFNADTCYNNLLEVIMNKFNDICPKKVARNRNDIKKTNNWITDEIKNKTTIKRQMYEDMKNGIIEANSYKTFCNALRIEIAAEKRKANSQYINNSQNRVKATWQLVRRITGYTKNKKSDITKIKIGDKINDDKHETLRYINTYLIDACKDMEKNLPDYCHI